MHQSKIWHSKKNDCRVSRTQFTYNQCARYRLQDDLLINCHLLAYTLRLPTSKPVKVTLESRCFYAWKAKDYKQLT